MAKTYVYRNLHKDQWSLMVRGIVQEHAKRVVLTNVEFRVRPAGHAKVLRDKRKNVHAFAVGTVGYQGDVSLALNTGNWGVEVGYNPYKGATFYRKDTGAPIAGARVVLLQPNYPGGSPVYRERGREADRQVRLTRTHVKWVKERGEACGK